MQGRTSLYLAAGSIATALAISILIHAPLGFGSPRFYSDVLDSFYTRDWLRAGSLPYVNSAYGLFEYPTVSGLLLYAVNAIGHSLEGFYATFSALSLIAAGFLVWSCWSITKKLGRNLNSFYFMLPSFVMYGIYNFDIFHAALVMLALQLFLYDRRDLSAVTLAVAVSTKLASAVLLPLLLLELRENRSWARFLGIFIAVVAVINLPFAFTNYKLFLAGYQFLGNWGLEDAWYVWIFQSPSTWPYAKLFGLGVAALLLIKVYRLKGDLMPRVFLTFTAYLLGTYIYSPQFNLLIIPIIAVLGLESPSLFFWEVFNALIILTWFFPGSTPTLAWSWPQAFALLRDIALVWLALSLIRREGYRLPKWLKLGQTGAPGEEPSATQPVEPVSAP